LSGPRALGYQLCSCKTFIVRVITTYTADSVAPLYIAVIYVLCVLHQRHLSALSLFIFRLAEISRMRICSRFLFRFTSCVTEIIGGPSPQLGYELRSKVNQSFVSQVPSFIFLACVPSALCSPLFARFLFRMWRSCMKCIIVIVCRW
jgi:hypothetical protein